MYTIQSFTYKDEPFIKEKKFTVHPLDDPGIDTYFSRESYTTTYLNKADQKAMNKMFYTEYIPSNNQQKELKKEKENIEEPAKTQPLEPNKRRTYTESQEIPPEHLNYTNEKEGEIYNRTLINPYFSCGRFSKTPKRTLMYHRRRNFKETYGYDRLDALKTKKDRCLFEINELKKNKLSNDEFNYTHSGSFYPKKRYSGFSSYAVPRVENRKEPSIAYKVFDDKLRATMNCLHRKTKSKNAFDTLKKENEELKGKLRLMTDGNVLERLKLPNVAQLAGSRMFVRNLKLGNSKELGEKYNPYCMNPKTGDLIGRNFVGALFNH